MKSAIEHEKAGMSCFVRVKAEKRTAIWISLLYTYICANLNGNENLIGMYWEPVMFSCAEWKRTYEVHFSDDVKDNNERHHRSWVIPAALNPRYSKNDP